MFRRCLVCHAAFEPNEELERFPLGRRIAFDPERGRLWAICGHCRRWSLAPIEERWEALEELERATRDRARPLAHTDNIALFRLGHLEIVRVGRARLAEEAWWRYGRELANRKQRWDRLGLAGTLGAGAVVAGGWATGGVTFVGMWLLMSHGSSGLRDGARWLRFGSTAWRGRSVCEGCGTELRSIPFRDRDQVGLFPASEREGIEVAARCPGCGRYRGGGLRLRGEEASRTVKRLLAYHHFAGASEGRVTAAARLIQEAGSPEALGRIVVKDGRRIGDLQRTGAIALEIAAHEASERHMLSLELAELQARWRREEELAAIVDGELTPLPVVERMRRTISAAMPGLVD